jgi:hypothetical protein
VSEAASTTLGFITCHVCGFDAVPVRPMKNNRACCICPECDVQTYCRSRVGDKLLREQVRPINQPARQEAPASEKPKQQPAAPAGKPAAVVADAGRPAARRGIFGRG